MPEFFVSLERAISQFAKATDQAAPPSAPGHSNELAPMTADAQQILFHAKLGSQTEILKLPSRARLLSASAQISIRSPVGEVYCRGWICAPPASAPAHHDALAPLE